MLVAFAVGFLLSSPAFATPDPKKFIRDVVGAIMETLYTFDYRWLSARRRLRIARRRPPSSTAASRQMEM